MVLSEKYTGVVQLRRGGASGVRATPARPQPFKKILNFFRPHMHIGIKTPRAELLRASPVRFTKIESRGVLIKATVLHPPRVSIREENVSLAILLAR